MSGLLQPEAAQGTVTATTTTTATASPPSLSVTPTPSITTTSHLITDRLTVPQFNSKRKFSFPVAFHKSSLLLGESTTLSARRRLSNVSDAVTRKLSSTIGWKQPVIPTKELVTQGKCLCGQYIRCRLRRAGLFNKKLGLQRIRSIIGTPSIHVVREVFPAFLHVGEELERMHPRIYNGIAKQILGSSRGGELLPTADSAPILLSSVARDLFRTDITWGKVVSLFAVVGGLSVDCVRQGNPEYLPKLLEGAADVIEDELVPWIYDNGGWVGLNKTIIRPVVARSTEFSVFAKMIIGILSLCGLFVIVIIIKYLGIYLYPNIFLNT